MTWLYWTNAVKESRAKKKKKKEEDSKEPADGDADLAQDDED